MQMPCLQLHLLHAYGPLLQTLAVHNLLTVQAVGKCLGVHEPHVVRCADTAPSQGGDGPLFPRGSKCFFVRPWLRLHNPLAQGIRGSQPPDSGHWAVGAAVFVSTSTRGRGEVVALAQAFKPTHPVPFFQKIPKIPHFDRHRR